MKLYNTMTRKKEEFRPLKKGKVRIYTCGQTVYDDLHIGNARTYSYWDILRRYLEWKGYDVFHVQNITDVGHLTDDAREEDKVEKSAREKGLEPMILVEEQLRKYYRDMDDLNILRHHINPRATGHIPEMIELIKKIIKNGYGYVRNGSVYFNVRKFDKRYKYAKMARIKIDELEAGARVDKRSEKKDPLDFALWIKAQPNHIMNWPSPWSIGYPGWHIECSTMSMKYLGEEFDIHGGGKDHIFPHHPNERAQSLAATGKEFVKYWIHANFLTVNGEKMAKSKRNFYTAREMIDKYGGEVLRMFYAMSHYRKEIDFNERAVKNAKNNLNKILKTLKLINESSGGKKKNIEKKIKEFEKNFETTMDDDLNTPKAVKLLLEFCKNVGKNLDNEKKILENASQKIKELGGILGLRLEPKSEDIGKRGEDLINLIINIREELREKNDYKLSDEIRKKLKKIGIKLEDVEGKTKWRIDS